MNSFTEKYSISCKKLHCNQNFNFKIKLSWLFIATCRTTLVLTIRLHCELYGFAECALSCDVQVYGGEAEVVACVIDFGISQVQVACHLGHKPPSSIWLDKARKIVEDPTVGKS